MLRETPDTFSIRRNLYQARLVFFLFIASLGMFFAACIGFYVMLIAGLKNSPYETTVAVTYRPLDLPLSFWLSTGAVDFDQRLVALRSA